MRIKLHTSPGETSWWGLPVLRVPFAALERMRVRALRGAISERLGVAEARLGPIAYADDGALIEVAGNDDLRAALAAMLPPSSTRRPPSESSAAAAPVRGGPAWTLHLHVTLRLAPGIGGAPPPHSPPSSSSSPAGLWDGGPRVAQDRARGGGWASFHIADDDSGGGNSDDSDSSSYEDDGSSSNTNSPTTTTVDGDGSARRTHRPRHQLCVSLVPDGSVVALLPPATPASATPSVPLPLPLSLRLSLDNEWICADPGSTAGGAQLQRRVEERNLLPGNYSARIVVMDGATGEPLPHSGRLFPLVVEPSIKVPPALLQIATYQAVTVHRAHLLTLERRWRRGGDGRAAARSVAGSVAGSGAGSGGVGTVGGNGGSDGGDGGDGGDGSDGAGLGVQDADSYVAGLVAASPFMRRIPLTRRYAVDGASLDVGELVERGVLDAAGAATVRDEGSVVEAVRLTKGAVGCALTHIDIWRRAAAEDLNVLVLEDDVALLHDFDRRLHEQVLARAPRSWGIIYLGSHRAAVTSAPLPHAPGLRRIAGGHYGTFGYLVSGRGARALLEGVFPLRSQIDSYIIDRSWQVAAGEAEKAEGAGKAGKAGNEPQQVVLETYVASPPLVAEFWRGTSDVQRLRKHIGEKVAG